MCAVRAVWGPRPALFQAFFWCIRKSYKWDPWSLAPMPERHRTLGLSALPFSVFRLPVFCLTACLSARSSCLARLFVVKQNWKKPVKWRHSNFIPTSFLCLCRPQARLDGCFSLSVEINLSLNFDPLKQLTGTGHLQSLFTATQIHSMIALGGIRRLDD